MKLIIISRVFTFHGRIWFFHTFQWEWRVGYRIIYILGDNFQKHIIFDLKWSCGVWGRLAEEMSGHLKDFTVIIQVSMVKKNKSVTWFTAVLQNIGIPNIIRDAFRHNTHTKTTFKPMFSAKINFLWVSE